MLFILGGALVSIFCALLPYPIQGLLAVVSVIYAGYLFHGPVLLKDPKAIVALACRADQSWWLRERSGAEYPALLCGDSTRLPWVSVLRFKPLPPFPGRRRSVVLFYDAIDPVCYRRLQMRLSIPTIH